MQLPPGPETGPDRSQDAFDFGQGTPTSGRAFLQQLMEDAESVVSLDAEQRRHLAIAATAVGALWIAPVLAGRRRRARRRRRPPRAV